jgi:integrase
MGAVIALPLPEPPEEPRRRRSKKRANGQGTIYQRKDGRWTGAVFVLTADGTFKRVPVYGRTAEEVDAKLTELKSRSNRGLPAEATGWTVGTYAAYWTEHVAAPKLRPATLARYRSLLAGYVLPAIGKKKLAALTPPMCGSCWPKPPPSAPPVARANPKTNAPSCPPAPCSRSTPFFGPCSAKPPGRN